MTRKRRKRKNEAKHRAQSTAGVGLPPIGDPRMMEQLLRRITAKIEEEGIESVSGPIDLDDLEPLRPCTPLDKAQEVIYEALAERSPPRQVTLAKKALQISKDCADAYVLLAENAATPEESVELYQRGVAAGERALGKRTFKEDVGHFWGVIETRPYMRARKGLADTLWGMRQHEEAVAHYWEMLRLNPGDNQGVRFMLVYALLDMEEHRPLHDLLESYDDDAASEWAYAAALLAFREEGDSQRSRRLLHKAEKANHYVPAYLAGTRRLPAEQPEYVSIGHEDEAVALVARYLPLWKTTPGATVWLRRTLKLPVHESATPPRAPTWREIKASVAALPQESSDVWEIDIRPFPMTLEAGDVQVKPWMIFIYSTRERELLTLEMAEDRPQPKVVWNYVLAAMGEPEGREPRRPGRIDVRLKTLHTAWKSKLAQVGVECRVSPTMENTDRFAQMMAESGGPIMDKFLAGVSDTNIPTPDEMARLPQSEGEVWQADVRQSAFWIDVEGEPQRPWVTIVTNTTDHMILATDLCENDPGPGGLWNGVCNAMRHPAVGEPRRPGTIQLMTGTAARETASRLESAGIQPLVADRLDELDELFQDMTEHLEGPRRVSAMLDAPGVTPEQLGRFFHAAAVYYRAAPWRCVPGDATIEIQCDHFQSGPWYGVVMGQMGIELGLALYEDLDLLRELYADATDAEEFRRRNSGLSVLFGEAFNIAPKDLVAAERYDWPVAGPEAYPFAIRINPGMAFRPPLIWELELLEACLLSIPDFVRQPEEQQTRTMRVASGEVVLSLTRIDQ